MGDGGPEFLLALGELGDSGLQPLKPPFGLLTRLDQLGHGGLYTSEPLFGRSVSLKEFLNARRHLQQFPAEQEAAQFSLPLWVLLQQADQVVEVLNGEWHCDKEPP